MTDIETKLIEQGYLTICGVDEAGRGPLAGPVYAAAVILPQSVLLPPIVRLSSHERVSGIKDSKKLTQAARERLYDEIVSIAVSFSIGVASSAEIDEFNILNATFIAMNRAIEGLSIKPDISLIDGNRNAGIKHHNKCITGGDNKSLSIAAASILAKVSRDRYMLELSKKYPQYAFEKHKGYGTKLHYEMLCKHGPSDIHRVTFLKGMGAKNGHS